MGKPVNKPEVSIPDMPANSLGTALATASPAISAAINSGTAIAPQHVDVGSGKLSHGTLNHLLKSAGASINHVGGTLPPIGFANQGDAYLLQFLARDEATDEREFSILVFEVLDPRKWVETRDAEASKLYRGTITESWAFKEYCSAKNANYGAVLKVTYLGTQKVKSANHNDVKLFAIEEIAFAPTAPTDGKKRK